MLSASKSASTRARSSPACSARTGRYSRISAITLAVETSPTSTGKEFNITLDAACPAATDRRTLASAASRTTGLPPGFEVTDQLLLRHAAPAEMLGDLLTELLEELHPELLG